MQRRSLCLFAFLAAAFLAGPSALYAQAPADVSMEDLSFIEGHWTGMFRGASPYETMWSGPDGNAYVGTIRFFEGENTRMFEILTIEHTDKGITMHVKHFRPGLIGLEEKEDSNRYHLVEMEDGRAVFEQEGAETRLALIRTPPSEHLVQIASKENGEWVWTDLFVGKPAR